MPPRLLAVVLTSPATQHRALAAHAGWCGRPELSCAFASDQPFRGTAPPSMRWAIVKASPPPISRCCHHGKGFFCSPHRKRTLAAQHRYLPALHRVGVQQLRVQPHLRWLLLLDDDAFVFVGNLVPATSAPQPPASSERAVLAQLLARYDHRKRLLIGELKPGGAYACGGAGTALSRAASLQLDLPGCIARFRHRCMQSDWMLADCVRSSGVRFIGVHGCGSCSVKGAAAADDVLAANVGAGCHFMQNAGRHLARMPTNCSSPSIVHGYSTDSQLVSEVLAQRQKIQLGNGSLPVFRGRTKRRITSGQCQPLAIRFGVQAAN
ncbi:MAG: hypothetical protein SGPRY_006241 [Prymnesium sp.]